MSELLHNVHVYYISVVNASLQAKFGSWLVGQQHLVKDYDKFFISSNVVLNLCTIWGKQVLIELEKKNLADKQR